MDDFEAFKVYVAMKSHFQGDYNYKKYSGKQNIRESAFHKRQDKSTFQELSRRFTKKELEEFLLATFLTSNSEYMWTGNLLDEETLNAYKEWKSRVQSMSYNFREDVHKIIDKAVEKDLRFDNIFKSVKGEYPFVMKMENLGEISLETFIILDKMFDILETQDKKVRDSIFYPMYKKKCQNYSDFLNINIEHYKQMFRQIIVEEYWDEYGYSLGG
jgi:hypothetical protein